MVDRIDEMRAQIESWEFDGAIFPSEANRFYERLDSIKSREDEVKVLALNDDHNTTFHLESDSTGYDMRGFVKFLAQHHLSDYKVRYVHLIDIPDDDIKAQEAFDVVDGVTKAMPYYKAFDFLWGVYGKDW